MKLWYGLLVILFFAMPLNLSALQNGDCAFASYSAQDYFQAGVDAFSAEDYDQAVIYYTCSLSLDPEFADAYLARIGAYNALGRYDDALQELELFSTYENLSVDFEMVIRAGIYIEYQADYEAARLLCLRALAINADPNTYSLLGYIEAHLGNFELAIQFLDQALDISPNNPSSFSYFFERAFAHYRMQNISLAREDIERALELRPDLINSTLDRTLRYSDLGHTHLVNDGLARIAMYYELMVAED